METEEKMKNKKINNQEVMNNKFDELTKGLVQSITRRQALRRLGVGIAGLALATLGLTNKAQADPGKGKAKHGHCNHCTPPFYGCAPTDGACIDGCIGYCSSIR
jgi:hypothetical protein